ncbi:porin [Geomonas sp. RF6]|uniref:porin n=1 Tax=Geomonas sp. RF6 TaxID=2897342 RepID=UPI001E529C36|nr:porin [Geomonas sp. RF6]UFS69873.1 porin [Geomonas sp. RF6]
MLNLLLSIGKILLISLPLFLTLPLLTSEDLARAEEPKASPETHDPFLAMAPNKTPLAGREYRTLFMGREVEIPPRDRSHVSAITLGGAYAMPKVGNQDGTPIFSLFFRRFWANSRTRDLVSGFVNDLEYDRGKGPLELVLRFENDTRPFDRKEVLNNREINGSSLYWGTLIGSIGPGLRFPIPPYEIDNDIRVQLLANVGYFYAKKSSDTAPDAVVPPDTMLYGTKLRLRYDGMIRNILELPHRGTAAGFDLQFMHRDRWSDFHTLGSTVFSEAHTRDYLQFSGYAMAAADIPGLSEKNRLLLSIHGGTAKTSSIDRFNAFRISGGPFPTETDDLYRPDYEGTMFNELIVANYLLASAEFRRQLTFFSYLGLRASYIGGDLARLTDGNEVVFSKREGFALSANFDTGFFWDSSLHLAYSWDSGFVRDGRSGSGIILTWNKEW